MTLRHLHVCIYVCMPDYEANGLCLPCVLPLDVTSDGFVLLVMLHNVLWVIVGCA